MRYFLGIDQGSHSSRAVLFDADGKVLEQAAQTITPQRPGSGQVEYSAEALLDSVTAVIEQLMDTLGRAHVRRIAASGIATQRSTALAWNTDGQALSPALSWQDVRASSRVDRLQQHAGDIRRLTGLPLTPYYSASKMRWLLDHNDKVRQCTRERLRLSPLISYLLFHLLDNRPYVIDYSNAQRTQLFDLDQLTWSARLAHWFDIEPGLLPECRPMHSDYGKLLATDIPVMAVCGDQNAAMYGAGSLAPGEALINIGSGAFILRELDGFSRSDTQLTGIAYADSNGIRYLREATINGGANALSWAEQQWGIEDIITHLPGWMRAVKHPPLFINTVGGLGTPWMRSDITTTFIGSGTYTNAEKAVAIVESIVFMIQLNLELLAAEAPITGVRLSGGLSNLDGLCQKLSDLSGYVTERSEVAEASARGAAWLAAGRPQRWNIGEAEQGARLRYTPQPAEDLALRYRRFRTELEQRL